MTDSLNIDANYIFKDLLLSSFEKIMKNLPKKYKEIRDLILKFKDQLAIQKDINANQYFILYKYCIETKNNKLIEISLYYIQKLISYGFLDGNCKDYTYGKHIEDYNPSKVEPIEPDKIRRLIDGIVESICLCQIDKDDNIQLLIIKALLTIATSIYCEIHDKTLLEIFRVFYNIFITSKNLNNQTSSRAALSQMLHMVFQRMEGYNNLQDNNDEDQNKSIIKGKGLFLNSTIALNNTTTASANNINMNNTNKLINNTDDNFNSIILPMADLAKNNDLSSIQNDNISLPDIINDDLVDNLKHCIHYEPTDPLEYYMYQTLQHIIDDICIYNEKRNIVKAKVKIQSPTHDNIENDPQKDILQLELENIPLRCVPYSLNPDDPKYRNIIQVNLSNEKGVNSGLFGWCFVCRGPAKLYCKDTRVPICSIECKNKHFEDLEDLEVLKLESPKSEEKNHNANLYFNDAVQIFKTLCKLCGKEQSTNMNPYTLKSKILLLELILTILDNPGQTFLNRREFLEIIRENLCESILKNALSTEKQVIGLSLGIFVNLVKYFRDNLKQEIYVFIDNVFLKMLESGNTSYYHRLVALQVFYTITQKPIPLLEFYVNYDCDVKQTNIVEKIFEFLSKIAQGKYSKSEYSGMLNQREEQNLRILALESMVAIVKNLVGFAEDYERKIEENRKKAAVAITINDNQMGMINDKDIEDYPSITEEAKDLNFDKTDTIEKARIYKIELQKAAQKFNFKPKIGLKYLVNLGIIRENNAKDIANYIKNTPNLSKEKIGEYFGDEMQINIEVLTEYTEELNFKDMQMDEALRMFLNGFDLPGESQKVDRIMEVFAGKYVRDCPEIFSSSTGAYQMAYLLMMLQTDAHNPQVKDKMKLNDFIKLTKGLNDGKELSADMLNGFYNRILKNPLALPTTEKMKKQVIDQSKESLKKKQENFMVESAKMIEKGKELIKHKSSSTYITVNNTDYIRPLFEIYWSPLLAVLSIIMEQIDDIKIIQICLDGFIHAIKLTGMFSLNTERDAFVLSLVKFTYLNSSKEIKEKNLRCIKTLLHIATTQGNYLNSSWKFMLECISKIDYYFHYIPLRREDNSIFSDLARGITKGDPIDQIEIINSEIIRNNIDPSSIDFIFNKSHTLELDGIIEFISGLCKISEEELKNISNPRTYSLQKIVEVAHFNMDRIKFIWSQIWNILKEYFIKVGLCQNKSVSMFAIDSLKQLAIKFLKKDELTNSDFQKQFLKPFEIIFLQIKSENFDIQDLILNCLQNIISHSKKTIKSGWKIIFDILSISAISERDQLIASGYKLIQNIMNDNLQGLNDYLVDLLNVNLQYLKCKHEEIVKQTLDNILIIINEINMAKICKINHNKVKQQYIKNDSIADDEIKTSGSKTAIETTLTIEATTTTTMVKSVVNYNLPYGENSNKNNANHHRIYHGLTEETWMKTLSSLAMMVSDPRQNIRSQSLQNLFKLLNTYGDDYSNDFWQVILSSVIKLLFDEIQYSMQSKKFVTKEEIQYFRDTCEKAFLELIRLYNNFFNNLRLFTDSIFAIILDTIQNLQESLVKVSISALRGLISACCDRFQVEEWQKLVNIIEKIIISTTPNQLFESKNIQPPTSESDKILKFKGTECITQCIVQLLMISLIKELIEKSYDKFSFEQIQKFLSILESSYKFARSFNDQIYLRYCLWKNGFNQDMQQLPGLLKQEKEAISVFLTLLHMIYTKCDNTSKSKAEILNQFIDHVLKILTSYTLKHEEYIDTIKKNGYEINKNDEQIQDDSSIEIALKRLKLHELERDLLNLKGIISQVILPKLSTIEIDELKNRIVDISLTLINITANSFAKCYACYTDPNHTNCPKNLTNYNEDNDGQLRLLLIKYFDYCTEQMNIN